MTRVTLFLLAATTAIAAQPPRARPPVFTDEDRSAFFDDGFATLVGERPQAAVPAAKPTAVATSPLAAAANWAALIDADTLETEIKRQAQRLASATRSTSAFKAGGYRDAVDALGLAAAWFAVTADHTGEPRWRDSAAGLRDLFGAAASEADGSSDAAYAAATSRSADLTDLVRGARPEVPEPSAEVDWSEAAPRSTVMRRMATAEEERLGPWLADERSLRRNAEDARHEAQVLAALAEAIVQPVAYDADDEDYRAYAARLREAARRLATAAEAENQPAAAAAMTDVSRSCVDCHADYRG